MGRFFAGGCLMGAVVLLLNLAFYGALIAGAAYIVKLVLF